MSDERPKVEPKSDESWKEQVAAEKAAAAGEAAPTTATEADSASATGEPVDFDTMQMPPANFTTLISMLSTQAMVSLGMFPEPGSDTPVQRLPLAKHFIDLLGVIEEKTRRNLTGHEANLLEGTLHELRMVFVEMSKPKT
ncbi:MAG: DUF1844 domain-containing protein [Planctomycetaceae bacterium]